MKKSTIIILAVIAVLGIWCYSSYNGLVEREQEAKKEASNVQNQYQRRWDLIDNLVNTVQGYTKHEESVFKEVAEARAKATSPMSIDPSNCTPEQLAEFQKQQENLWASFKSINLASITESYPELKANTLFENLQVELAGTENRINEARRRYNDAATEYNKKTKYFPTNILASIFGFHQMELFNASADAQNAPKVNFNK